MEIVIGTILALLLWTAIISVWTGYSVWQWEPICAWLERKGRWKRNENEVCKCRDSKAVICAAVTLCIVEFFVIYMLRLDCRRFTQCKLLLVFILTTMVSLIDYTRKIIPNILVGGTILIRFLLLAGEFIFEKKYFRAVVFSDLVGLVFGFGILLLIAVFTKQALGYGDVKLFAAIGMTLGFIGTYNTLFYGLLFTLFVAVYALLVQKKGRKYKLPFAPFIWLGYLCVLGFHAF